MKSKYDVLKLISDNIKMGLAAFGQQVSDGKGGPGWKVMEGNQQSFKNVDQVVLLTNLKNDRVGWQSKGYVMNEETKVADRCESWIEQQEWEIKALLNRTTGPVTGDTMTSDDICLMLISWFNSVGCEEFRKNRCANLLINPRDVKTYNDSSDVSQYRSSFVLKLQVPKMFVFKTPTASVKFRGFIGVR